MVELIWDQMMPLVELVAEKAPQDIVVSAVRENLLAGTMMAVIVYREQTIIAVNVLDVKTLDSGIKVLYVPIIGGAELDLWAEDFMTLLKAVAKDYGCSELRGMAVRKGWMTKLKPLGWEEMFTTVRCKLGE
jgi:hypothetical protein